MAYEKPHDNDNPELDGPAPTPSEMGMSQTPTASPDTKSKGPYIPVPLKSLAQPGEDDQMNTPNVGDMVEFHGQGKLDRIEGDQGIVCLETVNGDPVTAEAAATNQTDPADEFAQLRQQASSQMM